MDEKLLIERNGEILIDWIPLVEQAGEDENTLRGLSFKHRFLMHGTESAVTAFLSPLSPHRGDRGLLEGAEKSLNLMLASLNKDGTCNSVNMASPPDTAFVTERVGALLVLMEREQGETSRSATLIPLLKEYLERTADALVTGGIHTPNHRWVVASALSYAWHILGKESYRKRALEWLDEGIDLDGDGQFCERSASIYSPVSVHCLLNVAEYLEQEDLYEGISRHLAMTLSYFTPAGTLLTLASRRQDAFFPGNPGGYWLPYRIMALREGKGEFARAARFIEEKGFTPGHGLTEYLSGRGAGNLPDERGTLPVKEDRFFPGSGIFRSYDGDLFYALFGGSDREDPFRPISGLAHHPTFLTCSRGSAVLKSMRIASLFFSTGYFRADEMEVRGNRCRMSRRLSVPYFDRLPDGEIRPDGLYPLTSSGRYWSRMDFPRRDQVNVQTMVLTVETERRGQGLAITVRADDCPPVPVALEFQFPQEGELQGDLRGEGVERQESLSLFGNPREALPENVTVLKSGSLVYTRDGHSLTLGSGRYEHDWLPCDQGDDFFPLQKELGENRIVYIPLYAPFEINLTIE